MLVLSVETSDGRLFKVERERSNEKSMYETSYYSILGVISNSYSIFLS